MESNKQTKKQRKPRGLNRDFSFVDYCEKIDCHNSEASEKHSIFKRCNGCASVLYCSRKCQKLDWKCHKSSCGQPDNLSKKKFDHQKSVQKYLTEVAKIQLKMVQNGVWWNKIEWHGDYLPIWIILVNPGKVSMSHFTNRQIDMLHIPTFILAGVSDCMAPSLFLDEYWRIPELFRRIAVSKLKP